MTYFHIDARGAIIKIPIDIAEKIPLFAAYIQRWNEEKMPYYVNYSPDAVHKILDRFTESIEDFLCIKKPLPKFVRTVDDLKECIDENGMMRSIYWDDVKIRDQLVEEDPICKKITCDATVSFQGLSYGVSGFYTNGRVTICLSMSKSYNCSCARCEFRSETTGKKRILECIQYWANRNFYKIARAR